MTILPKRNKRRLDPRDSDSSHTSHHVHNSGIRESQSGSPGQLQLETPSSSHHHHGGHGHSALTQGHLPGHIYQSLPHRLEGHRIPGPTEPKRSRRSPPLRGTTDDTHSRGHGHSLHKKSRRPKHGQGNHEHKRSHGETSTSSSSQKPLTISASYASGLPGSSSGLETLQTLIAPASITPPEHLSPKCMKIPGGAQEGSGTVRNKPSPEGVESLPPDEETRAPSPGGCNSEDEYGPSDVHGEFTDELEQTFEHALQNKLGLFIKPMGMDGSCLFRAIADQVYGDQEMHDVVRTHCVDYMAKNSDHFSNYVTENFNTYLQRKRQLGCHGNHVEVQALSEMYNRPIEVYQYSLKPINIFTGPYSAESAFPIRLTYHRNTHYNSLVDPTKPTIGVGLGLPGFKPRVVEQNIVAETERRSERYHIEEAMLNDKIRETDWELTDDAIQEQVARESYLQYLQDCQKRDRRRPACTVTGPSCSGTEETINWGEKLSHVSSPQPSPRSSDSKKAASPRPPETKPQEASTGNSTLMNDQACSSSGSGLDLTTETKTFLDLEPFAVYSYNDNIDEGEAIARAIAASQQDFISSLTKKS